MQEEIKKIEIILENCEVVTVEGKHIGDFSCNNIEYSINRMGYNYIGETYTCKDFSMSIHKDCALNDKEEWSFGTLDGKRNPLKRINDYKDIASIYIYFTNDKKDAKQIYVEWGGDNECINEYQKSYINRLGDLFIVISKDLKLEDVFDLEEIEDEDFMGFTWDMYS